MKGAVTILRLGSLEGGDDGGTLVSPHVIRDQVPCAAWPWLPRGKAQRSLVPCRLGRYQNIVVSCQEGRRPVVTARRDQTQSKGRRVEGVGAGPRGSRPEATIQTKVALIAYRLPFMPSNVHVLRIFGTLDISMPCNTPELTSKLLTDLRSRCVEAGLTLMVARQPIHLAILCVRGASPATRTEPHSPAPPHPSPRVNRPCSPPAHLQRLALLAGMGDREIPAPVGQETNGTDPLSQSSKVRIGNRPVVDLRAAHWHPHARLRWPVHRSSKWFFGMEWPSTRQIHRKGCPLCARRVHRLRRQYRSWTPALPLRIAKGHRRPPSPPSASGGDHP